MSNRRTFLKSVAGAGIAAQDNTFTIQPPERYTITLYSGGVAVRQWNGIESPDLAGEGNVVHFLDSSGHQVTVYGTCTVEAM